MQLSQAPGLKVMLHRSNLIKITTPVFKSPSSPMDIARVLLVGGMVGVLAGVDITVTQGYKPIKSFTQLA